MDDPVDLNDETGKPRAVMPIILDYEKNLREIATTLKPLNNTLYSIQQERYEKAAERRKQRGEKGRAKTT